MRCLRCLRAYPLANAIDGARLSAYSRFIALISP
jgi:hypothetical protein